MPRLSFRLLIRWWKDYLQWTADTWGSFCCFQSSFVKGYGHKEAESLEMTNVPEECFSPLDLFFKNVKKKMKTLSWLLFCHALSTSVKQR